MPVRPDSDDDARVATTSEEAQNAQGKAAAARPRRRWRWVRRAVAVVGALVVVAVAGALIYVRSAPFGASPSGERLARIERSPQWQNGEFADPWPQWMSPTASIPGGGSDTSSPDQPLTIAATDTGLLAVPPAQGVRVTWFGHSSTLVEIDGLRVLIDPVWGERAGPSGLVGVRPFYPPPAALADLGRLDVVLISHDHWDHLDYPTVRAMAGWSATTFVVPLGIGAHLQRWGIPSDRIRELDWWDSATVGSVELVATPARHSSARDPLRSSETLWSGWALRGPQHRIWYSGDTGFFADLAQIGQRLGPFVLTLIDSGQYDPKWPDTHLSPELAVEANERVRGELMIPVHWGRFSLAPHSWTEPVERVRAEAACRGQSYLALVPGVPTEPTEDAVAAQQQWWPALPWRTAAQAPIRPTVNGDPDRRLDMQICSTGGR